MTTLALGLNDRPREHDEFLSLLPIIRRYARRAFSHWPPVHREEALAEATAAGLLSFISLRRRGKDPFAFPTKIALRAIQHVLNGRRVGSRDNSRDVTSYVAQLRHDFAVDSFSTLGQWHCSLIDYSQTPVPDQVCFRLDFAAWLQTLTLRQQRITRLLVLGYTTSEVAQRFQLTAGRISQLRRELFESWHAFHHETTPDA